MMTTSQSFAKSWVFPVPEHEKTDSSSNFTAASASMDFLLQMLPVSSSVVGGGLSRAERMFKLMNISWKWAIFFSAAMPTALHWTQRQILWMESTFYRINRERGGVDIPYQWIWAFCFCNFVGIYIVTKFELLLTFSTTRPFQQNNAMQLDFVD